MSKRKSEQNIKKKRTKYRRKAAAKKAEAKGALQHTPTSPSDQAASVGNPLSANADKTEPVPAYEEVTSSTKKSAQGVSSDREGSLLSDPAPAGPAASSSPSTNASLYFKMSNCDSAAHNEIRREFIKYVEEEYGLFYALNHAQRHITGPLVPPPFDVENIPALSHRICSFLSHKAITYHRTKEWPSRSMLYRWSELLLDICTKICLEVVGQEIAESPVLTYSFNTILNLMEAFRSFHFDLPGGVPGLYVSINSYIEEIVETFDLPESTDCGTESDVGKEKRNG
jgi:hypothetical protein